MYGYSVTDRSYFVAIFRHNQTSIDAEKQFKNGNLGLILLIIYCTHICSRKKLMLLEEVVVWETR